MQQVQPGPLALMEPQVLLALPEQMVQEHQESLEQQAHQQVQPEPYLVALADHLPAVLAEVSQRNQPLSGCLPE